MQHLVSRTEWGESFSQQKWETAQKFSSHACKCPFVTNAITHNHCLLVSPQRWLLFLVPDWAHVLGIKVWLHEVCTLSYDNSLLSWIWRWEIGFDNIHFILIRKKKTLASGLSVTLCAVLTSVNNMFFHSVPMSAVLCGTNHLLSISEWGWPARNKAFNSLCIWFKRKPLLSQTPLQLLHGKTFYDGIGSCGQTGRIKDRKPHAGPTV